MEVTEIDTNNEEDHQEEVNILPATEVVKIEAQPDPPTSNPSSSQLLSSNDLPLGSLASQLCPLGPKDRCTPSQAQAMGQQVLALMAMHEANAISLPYELKNTFDIFHRCLAVAYGTFFLNLYTKANAPCLLCHGCKCLYPPGQYIHHACPALPPNIVPCRSRMWRRCLVPLVSSDIDKVQQKERWKYVLEKFSHSSTGVTRRNRLHPEAETLLLEMPECKRGRFVKPPSETGTSSLVQQIVTTPTSSSNSERMTWKGLVALSPSPTESRDTETHDEDDDLSLEEHNTTTNMTTTTATSQITTDKPGHKAIELLEQLLKEVHRLEQELIETKKQLQSTNSKLKLLISGNSLSEQLVHSLIAQEKLTAERDRALEHAKEAEERAEMLESHFKKMKKLQNEVESVL